VLTGSWEDGYKARLYSEDNNFGLMLYDLWIKKSIDDAYRMDGTTGTYTLRFGNYGPVTARNVVITDWYDADKIFPITDTLNLGTLPATTKVVWSGNQLVLSNLPEFVSGASYSVSFQASFKGKDVQAINTVKIYAGPDKTDRLENSVFVNNEDKVPVTIIAKSSDLGKS
jgi:uncharacterized repeat protein (TIGR01451 family)